MSTIGPPAVDAVARAATTAGFGFSCDPGTGRLLAVLAAAVPRNGRVLELGTGAGVGLAWMVHGLDGRADVRVVSVEADPAVAAVAAAHPWPTHVELVVGDGLDALRREREQRWDLVFADAPAGKWEGLDDTIEALAPGGLLVVDDMTPDGFVDGHHARKTAEVRERLVGDHRLVTVELSCSTGLVVAARRAGG